MSPDAAARLYWLDSDQLDLELPLLPQIIDGLSRSSALVVLDNSREPTFPLGGM